MYKAFFRLKEKPFHVTPDPRYFFGAGSHKQALTNLIYDFRQNRGFSLLIGEAGSGKTSLVNYLVGRLGGRIIPVIIAHAKPTFGAILTEMLESIGAAVDPSMDHYQMLKILKRNMTVKQGLPTVSLFIDEAQHLDIEVLESVRMLSNLETQQTKLIHICLSGQPAITDKLQIPQLEQLRQRIGAVSRLLPLTAEEASLYLGHRLGVAGHHGPPLFADEAVDLIYQHSEGLPRVINQLADLCLFTAFLNDRPTVEHDLARAALEQWARNSIGRSDRDLDGRPPRFARQDTALHFLKEDDADPVRDAIFQPGDKDDLKVPPVTRRPRRRALALTLAATAVMAALAVLLFAAGAGLKGPSAPSSKLRLPTSAGQIRNPASTAISGPEVRRPGSVSPMAAKGVF